MTLIMFNISIDFPSFKIFFNRRINVYKLFPSNSFAIDLHYFVHLSFWGDWHLKVETSMALV